MIKYKGKVSVSTLLTESGKCFKSLPKLDAYPGGVCWLHAIATCPFKDCAFANGHINQGNMTKVQVDETVAALQPGVTALLAKTPSPLGKCKWKGRGGIGGGSPLRPQI